MPTYSGHPLAAASIVGILRAMADERVVENSRTIGETVIGPHLARLAATHEVVEEVRGTGVFWAVELVADRVSREPLDAATMSRLKLSLLSAGLLPFIAENRVHIVPPAVITPAEAEHGLTLLDEALAVLR